MTLYLNKLKDYLANAAADQEITDATTPLEILYRFYAEYVAADTAVTRRSFQSLEEPLGKLTPGEQNAVMDALCDVCTEQERAAFIGGTHLGAALMAELSGR